MTRQVILRKVEEDIAGTLHTMHVTQKQAIANPQTQEEHERNAILQRTIEAQKDFLLKMRLLSLQLQNEKVALKEVATSIHNIEIELLGKAKAIQKEFEGVVAPYDLRNVMVMEHLARAQEASKLKEDVLKLIGEPKKGVVPVTAPKIETPKVVLLSANSHEATPVAKMEDKPKPIPKPVKVQSTGSGNKTAEAKFAMFGFKMMSKELKALDSTAEVGRSKVVTKTSIITKHDKDFEVAAKDAAVDEAGIRQMALESRTIAAKLGKRSAGKIENVTIEQARLFDKYMKEEIPGLPKLDAIFAKTIMDKLKEDVVDVGTSQQNHGRKERAHS
jgi:hypothetical protein